MRKMGITSFGLALLCGMPQLSIAQQSATGVSSVLSSSLAAQIGKVPVQTVQLQGTVEAIAGSDDETVPFLYEALSSGSSRTEIDFPAGNLIEIRQTNASGTAGVWSKGSSEQHTMAGHNLMTDASWCFPILVEERLISDPNAIVSFIGIEDGVAHFRVVQTVATTIPLSATDQIQHLSQVDLFLDYATLLPKQLSFNVHPDDNALIDISVTVQYSAYRTMSGANMPTRVQEFINNTLARDITVQNATLNASLSQSDFTWQ